MFRHANERKVKGVEFDALENIKEDIGEFENIPSDNDSDEGNISKENKKLRIIILLSIFYCKSFVN